MTNKWKDGLPPVGEECEITVLDTDGLFRNCKILYIDSMSVVFSSSAASSMPKYLSEVKFRPLKTPEEIERENLVNQMFTDAEVTGSKSSFERLVDKGYRKVKPMPLVTFLEMVGMANSEGLSAAYQEAVKLGYIIGVEDD